MYRREHPKELNYNEDVCRVSTAEHESKSCSSSDSEEMSSFAVWGVTHDTPDLINTTIEVKFSASKSSKAMSELDKYQVFLNESIPSERRSLSLDRRHISMLVR